MKKSILFSVLVVGATLLQAQSITVHQTCGQNGQVVKAILDAIDLGLSVKWATMNVGATTPEGYGDYFAWGETSTKDTYNWSTYFDTNDGGYTFTKYNNEGGKTVLDLEDDAAHVNLGGSWRMPTKAEWQELLDNCTWTWTTQNGINGYKVTSNIAGYTDKFIFLPAAGYRYGGGLDLVGSLGYYWSSSFYEYYSNNAWYLYFDSDNHGLNDDYRFCGRSVRPVLPSSISYSSSANDTICIYSNGCDDYQTFIGSHGGQLTMTANSDQLSYFVRWQDGNTSNPRTITTNGNANFTAIFAKYPVITYKYDSNLGYVEGPTTTPTGKAEDDITFTAYPNRGCYFVMWADGSTRNPRTYHLSQDVTMEAIFDYTPSGNCGKDNALTWKLDKTTMALEITGRGELSDNFNYTYDIESVTIGNEITSIGQYAFANCSKLKNVIIGSSVKVIEEYAFDDCYAITAITCYSMRPPTVNNGAFENLGYGTAVYVPADYFNTYMMHDFWGVYDVIPLGAASTQTDEVKVEPTTTTADVVWPAVDGAATYELVIKDKQGNVICTLIFNAQGQLTQIAFGAPSRNGALEQTQAAGFSFTVTGLEEGTAYDLTITSKDNSGATLDEKTIAFSTAGGTGVEDTQTDGLHSTKVLRDGKIYILRGEKTYTVQGQEVK